MYSNFKAQAIEYVKEAVEADNAGNYASAFPLYMNALEYFKTHLKYEKDPGIRDAITEKFTEYLRRAEEVQKMLAQLKPKTTNNKGGNNNNNNAEGVYHCNSMEQAMEYIKQAVEKDNAGQYPKAFHLYMAALEYFKTRLKYETNTEIRQEITKKFSQYIERAQLIRLVIDDVGGGSGSGSCGADEAKSKSKSKSEDGDNKDVGDDAKVEPRTTYCKFKEEGIKYLKEAVQEDHAQNYSKAFPLYMNALEYFKTHLKFEKNQKIREAILQKFPEYLRRAEEIQRYLSL